MTIDPQAVFVALVASLAGFITALTFYIRERAKTRSYVETQKSDVARLQEESRVNRDNTLAEIAKQGLITQERMIEAVNKNTLAFEELTRNTGQAAAETRGMVAMLGDNTKAVRSNTIAVDEINDQFPALKTDVHTIKGATETLKTDLEETIQQQFRPVVLALTAIGVSITDLVAAVQSKDVAVDAQITKIIDEFHSTHRELMAKLEPFVLKHLGDMTHDTPSVVTLGNHKTD